jgi:hypothetical protein
LLSGLALRFADALVAFLDALAPIVDSFPAPLLDALDHLCHLVEGDPEFEKEFYAASTPDEMVTLAVDGGILIDAEDFRALLRSGSTEFWLVRGEEGANPIAHLQQVFSV